MRNREPHFSDLLQDVIFSRTETTDCHEGKHADSDDCPMALMVIFRLNCKAKA
jgi:hypothetical protein